MQKLYAGYGFVKLARKQVPTRMTKHNDWIVYEPIKIYSRAGSGAAGTVPYDTHGAGFIVNAATRGAVGL